MAGDIMLPNSMATTKNILLIRAPMPRLIARQAPCGNSIFAGPMRIAPPACRYWINS